MSTISRFFINNNFYSLLKIQTETLYRHWKWKAKFVGLLARHNNCYEFMIIFNRQPPNFRLNCLSYHKKVLSFSGSWDLRPRTPHQGLCPWTPLGALLSDPRWGLRPRPPPHPPHRNPGSATGLSMLHHSQLRTVPTKTEDMSFRRP